MRKDAELAEFLLFIREDVANFEKNYSFNFPTKDAYVTEVRKLRPIFPSQISEDIHFRRWLWILLSCDAN